MGMYLMRQIGTRGVYANATLPDFMVFLNWKELPVYWYGFQHFPYAALMVVLVPGALAFVFGWFAFRSRVTGVYLSIITQALTFALMLGFFRNNFGFGGNNGLTDFKDILGFNVQAPGTRAALFGKYVCYAILALSIDLIWGYCGILSLGHGAFFALGGYAMGMYLMRQIGTRGVYANPILPDFMVFLNWKELPLYWYGFQHFAYAALMVVLVPGTLAFVFGWFAFRSRVTGVYLSIITQALTFALMLGFFRNNFGFGGNNGLTDFKDILGFNVQAQGTRAACSR